jgi:hypothetical protein
VSSYRRRCWTCFYAPGGRPWWAGHQRPEPKLWCGVGQRLVGRDSGEDCREWKLCQAPTRAMEKSP